MSNCPNCGAPITGPVCEYCDTRFPEYRESTECWADTVDGKRIVFNGVSSGILTPNEARELMGLRPVKFKDEWDTYHTPEQSKALHDFVVATAAKNTNKQLYDQAKRRSEEINNALKSPYGIKW